jgi:hypothetical protein
MSHFEAVLSNTRLIRKALRDTELEQFLAVPDADELTDIVALCHDLWDHKYCNSFEELRMKQELKHIIGCEIKADLIFDLIDNVSYSVEMRHSINLGAYQIILLIVRGADRIEALGETGINRCWTYNSHRFNDDIKQRVLNHIEEKLLTLSTHIECEAARIIAEPYQQYVIDYYESLRE